MRIRALAALCAATLLGAGCGGGSSSGAGSPPTDVADAGDVAPVEDVAESPDAPADDDADDADAPDAAPELPRTPGGLPLALPFVFERPDVGEPLTDEEVAAFTRRMTGLLKQIDYYTWVYETTHGHDPSTGQPGYLIWWHDVEAEKTGDLVTFRNNKEDGGSHNNAVPTMLALAQVLGGYLASGDPAAGRVAEQLIRSIHAVTLGFVHDADDPIDFLMARNIITQNHQFVLPSGKQKAVDYTEWYFPYEGWNADRFRYADNPTWGDIWVTNKRSKDDVPYFYRIAAWLPYVAELAPDEEVRQVAAEALDLLRRFAKDIVDTGYFIRTKDAEGTAIFVDGQDLDSFVDYVEVIPDAECDARLGTALLAYGDPLGQACGDGQGSLYDQLAGAGNYFNYDIFVFFHISAVPLALVAGHDEVARELLAGLVKRFERYRDPDTDEPGRTSGAWQKEITRWLLTSASVGYPLTSDEARQVHDWYLRTVDAFEAFPRWDLWDDSVPDGVYNFRDGGMYPAHQDDLIDVEFLAFVLEYCWSPFRNPAGVRFVDCDVVNDPSRWGE